MTSHEGYDPKSFWDAKAQHAGNDFEAAVCFDDPTANTIIDRIQKRYLRMAFSQVRRRMDLAGRQLLDYGCGTGRWVRFFQDYGLHYTGVDLSSEMVRIAAERFPDASFSTVDNTELRFESSTFDVACSIAVLHHNPYPDQDRILQQLCRALKQGGFLVLFESIAPIDPENVVEYPRPHMDWVKCLKEIGLEHIWSRQTRYFSTRTIMNKMAGENRFPVFTNRLAMFFDPFIGSFLPSRLHTRDAMVFQKTREKQ